LGGKLWTIAFKKGLDEMGFAALVDSVFLPERIE
jgi:hypothetical protein